MFLKMWCGSLGSFSISWEETIFLHMVWVFLATLSHCQMSPAILLVASIFLTATQKCRNVLFYLIEVAFNFQFLGIMGLLNVKMYE